MMIVFAAAMLMMSHAAFAQEAVQTSKALPRVYDEETNPNVFIDEALARAAAEGKNVVCQVGGNWCIWCLRFADFITSDKDISTFVSDNYVYALGNPVRFGFPVLVVLGADGTVLHIQDSSYLEEGSGYDKQKVMRFFVNWSRAAMGGF